VRSEREANLRKPTVIAAGLFRTHVFAGEPRAAAARAYCAKRGFMAATIERFGLGYGPKFVERSRGRAQGTTAWIWGWQPRPAWSRAVNAAIDFYRDRLMSRLRDYRGSSGLRRPRDRRRRPKYLNTATTPVYTKGHHLFALISNAAPHQSDRTLIVVEGYLADTLCIKAGIENTVAALGTSFTADNGRTSKIARYIYFASTVMQPVAALTTKAIDIASNTLESTGSPVRIVTLPFRRRPR